MGAQNFKPCFSYDSLFLKLLFKKKTSSKKKKKKEKRRAWKIDHQIGLIFFYNANILWIYYKCLKENNWWYKHQSVCTKHICNSRFRQDTATCILLLGQLLTLFNMRVINEQMSDKWKINMVGESSVAVQTVMRGTPCKLVRLHCHARTACLSGGGRATSVCFTPQFTSRDCFRPHLQTQTSPGAQSKA